MYLECQSVIALVLSLAITRNTPLQAIARNSWWVLGSLESPESRSERQNVAISSLLGETPCFPHCLWLPLASARSRLGCVTYLCTLEWIMGPLTTLNIPPLLRAGTAVECHRRPGSNISASCSAIQASRSSCVAAWKRRRLRAWIQCNFGAKQHRRENGATLLAFTSGFHSHSVVRTLLQRGAHSNAPPVVGRADVERYLDRVDYLQIEDKWTSRYRI